MATVNKDFKIKNGLIVEGVNGTINGYDILTKDSEDQEYIIGLIGGSANSQAVANAVVIRDEFANFAANVITANLVGNVVGQVSDISNHTTNALAEGSANLYFTNSRAEAAMVTPLTSGTQNNISVTYDSLTQTYTFVAENGVADSTTDDLEEGTANLYFSNARVRDAVSAGEGLNYSSTTGEFSAHLGYGLEIANNAIRIDDSVVATDSDVSTAVENHSNSISGVHGVTGDVVGTSDSQTLTNKVLSNAVSFGANIDAGEFTLTNLAEPSQASDAATKSYVDAVAEGLHIHASVAAATTENIAFSGHTAPGNELVLDGVTVPDGGRVLVKNQSTTSQNGIYVYDLSAGTLTRASDYDTAGEIQAGDFVFVSGGNTYAATGWVQENSVSTLGTDPIVWDQFSGAGTYSAGFGLDLDGTEFLVDSNVIATNSYVGNAISDHSNEITGIHGVTGDVVGTSDTQTLTNKTLGNSTVLGANLDAVNTYTVVNLEEPTNNQDAATKFYVDNAVDTLSNTVIDLDTDDIDEGLVNLYYSNTRVDEYINDSIDTDDVSEGLENLYFTNARAEAAMVNPLTLGVQNNISVTYDGLTQTYTFVAENGVADSDTDDLIEGTSNLYFTNARAVAALEAVTPDFAEIDINSVATQVAASTGNIETASQVTAYSWLKSSYRSAEFLVKVAYSAHTEISKVLLTMDTSDNIAITEYAIVGTNGALATVTADISGTDARLRVTTINNNSTVTIMGTLLV